MVITRAKNKFNLLVLRDILGYLLMLKSDEYVGKDGIIADDDVNKSENFSQQTLN